MTHLRRNMILRVITKLFIPPILLFAFYVQFHGDYGAGGGFQAGVILAGAWVLHTLIFGLNHTRQALPAGALQTLLSLGLLLYAGTGVLTLLKGGNYLGYSFLAQEASEGQHWGIFLVELGVGICVSAALVTIFTLFAGRGRS